MGMSELLKEGIPEEEDEEATLNQENVTEGEKDEVEDEHDEELDEGEEENEEEEEEEEEEDEEEEEKDGEEEDNQEEEVEKQEGEEGEVEVEDDGEPKRRKRKSKKKKKKKAPTPTAEISEDAMYDTDLEIEDERTEYHNISGARVYVETCQQLGVVPVSYVQRHLHDEQLVMRHHGLGPLGAKALAIPLVTNTSILTLDLDDNWLEDEGVSHLAEMLKENCFISTLILSNNRLRNRGAQTICDMLQWNSSLTSIDLSGNMFTDKDAPYFAAAILENSRLRELHLSRNGFTNCGDILGHAIGENESLEVLDLSWNHFRYKSALAIMDGVTGSPRLKTVNLSWNGLGNEGAVAIAECLKHNSVLTELDVSCNRIGPNGVLPIAKGMDVNETLKVFKISDNPIGSAGALILLNSVNNERSVLSHLHMENILVCKEFMKLEEEMLEAGRNLTVRHGGVLSNYTIDISPRKRRDTDTEVYNPVVAIRSYLSHHGAALADVLLHWPDTSKPLPADEFINIMRESCFELSDEQLAVLVAELDTTEEGVVDYSVFQDAVEGGS